jgi:regulator of sigma E protease
VGAAFRERFAGFPRGRGAMNPTAILNAAVPFLIVLLVLVIVHELGHFMTAKLARVTVQEFGFGYPPRLFGFKFKGTLYSLNLLPLGGFVKLLGEEDPAERGSFASQPVPTRLVILGAGPFMNAVLPIALLTASLMFPHQSVAGPVRIDEVAPNSPAEAAGVQPGDIVVQVNDRKIELPQDVRYNIQLNLGSPIDMTLDRDGQTKVVRMTPRWETPENQGPTGIKIVMRPEEVHEITVSKTLPQAFAEGLRGTFDMITLFKNGIYSTIMSRNGAAAVSGPIGIAQATGEVAKGGIPPLLEWTAFLSMNLAILNILPIPMLDGGRILFVLIEWVRRGRRIPPEREGLVHLIGFAALMAFILFVSYQDIMRITGGGSLIP